MDLELKGKRAIVTGGSRGIGRAIAAALLKEGARVAIAARNGANAIRAAAELGAEGDVRAFAVDTRDDDSVNAMVDAAVGWLGGLDILVNAAAKAGTPPAVPGIAGVDFADAIDELQTKVLGYLRVARAAAPHLIAAGGGRIINISGLAARRTGSIVGSIRNVAVAALTKALADELGPEGINVTVVHPGNTRTERTPGMIARRAEADGVSEAEAERRLFGGTLIGRIVEAEEVASVVAFLASPRAAAITGDAIPAGGGVPGPIFY